MRHLLGRRGAALLLPLLPPCHCRPMHRNPLACLPAPPACCACPLPRCRAGASARVVTAAELAASDIVLTTYDVLRRDVHHCPGAGDAPARSLRRRKKYEARRGRAG